MINSKTTLILFFTLVLVNCKSSKKSTISKHVSTTNNSANTTNTVVANTSNGTISFSAVPTETTSVVYGTSMAAKANSGFSAPGNVELQAIQNRFKDVTLETLSLGHSVYVGSCARCHGAKNIYQIMEPRWPGILDDMAPKARITDLEKDAVFKYVLAVMAAKPK